MRSDGCRCDGILAASAAAELGPRPVTAGVMAPVVAVAVVAVAVVTVTVVAVIVVAVTVVAVAAVPVRAAVVAVSATAVPVRVGILVFFRAFLVLPDAPVLRGGRLAEAKVMVPPATVLYVVDAVGG